MDEPMPTGAHQREHARRELRVPTFCRVAAEDGPMLRGDIVDLSRGGAGLLLPSWLPREQEVHLGFAALAGRGLILRARVRFARAHDDRFWRIGCEFGQPLSQDEFDALVANPA